MQENIVMAEKKPKLWLAILAAIGMGLVGCVLWGLLYYWGYIAWAVAFLIVLAACWAYKKINLKMDKKGYIIISVICVIEVILTMILTLNISVFIVLRGEGMNVSFFESFGYLFDVIKEANLVGAAIWDAVLSLIFIGLGIMAYYFIEKRKNDTKKDAVKTDDSAEVLNVEEKTEETKVEVEVKEEAKVEEKKEDK